MGNVGWLVRLLMKRCYVLLVNWNGWRDTIECLESLLQLDYQDFRIIVCDNGSSDGSLERIKSWAGETGPDLVDYSMSPLGSRPSPVSKPVPFIQYSRLQIEQGVNSSGNERLVLIDNHVNLGFAGGNNVGLKYLTSREDWDAVWLLNNDTVVEPDSLSELVNRVHNDPIIGICGSTLLYYREPEKIQALAGGYYCKWVGLPWLQGRFSVFNRDKTVASMARVETYMNYVMGASMLVSKAYLEQVGFMDEKYFLFFEETDWAWRGREKFRLGYAPSSIVYHKGGRSIGTSSNPFKKSLICDFFALRNRLVFSRLHCKEALPTIYLSLVAALLIRLCCGRWRNAAIILDILVGNDRKWQEKLIGHGPIYHEGEGAR